MGSSIGHAVGGLFGGGSSTPAEAQDNAVASQQTQDGGYQNNSWAQESCEPAAKGLANCLDQNNGNMQICTWYLDQLVGRFWIYICHQMLTQLLRNLARLLRVDTSHKTLIEIAGEVQL